jgi:uncharacterized protein GlcG (DUF336 family)
MRALACATGIVFAGAISFPATAQLIEQKGLSSAMTMTMAQVAIDTCKANGYRVSVAIVGNTAELLLHVRGDGASPHTMENSFRKAYTSRTFRVPSGDFTKNVGNNPLHPQLYLNNVIAFAGALPIKVGDTVIGAIGVSGAPGGEKDEVCAKAAIDKIADQLK